MAENIVAVDVIIKPRKIMHQTTITKYNHLTLFIIIFSL